MAHRSVHIPLPKPPPCRQSHAGRAKKEREPFDSPSRVLLVLQHRFIYPIVGLAPPGGEMVYLTSAKPISQHHGTAICVTHSVFLPLPLIAERGLSVVYLIRDSRSVGVLSQRRPPLA